MNRVFSFAVAGPALLLGLSVIGFAQLNSASHPAVPNSPSMLPAVTSAEFRDLTPLQQGAIAGPGLIETTPGATGTLYEITATQASENVLLTIQNLGDTRVTWTIGTGNAHVEPGESRSTRMTLSTPGGPCGTGLICWTAGDEPGVCRFAWVIRD